MKLISVMIALLLSSCFDNDKWIIIDEINLGSITPIGITFYQGNLWVSDGDHNQVVEIDNKGKIVKQIENTERPMHLDSNNDGLFIPEYGADRITKVLENKKTFMQIPDSLDAPTAISIYKKEIAIADFYHHRILYFDGIHWDFFGTKGHNEGELYYPTDIQITDHKIVVADAYNNRIQIFDKKGNTIQTIGENEKMNASTGVFVNDKSIFVTDFENNRVLIYDHDGVLEQVLEEKINKPTDVLVVADTLFIANYKGKSILKLKK